MAQSVLIRLSRENARELERLKRLVDARSVDATIAFLLKRARVVALRKMLGSDVGRVRRWGRRDRWEDRD